MPRSAHNPLQHVFVIDDDEGILQLQRRTLERGGYRVTTSASAEAAQPIIVQSAPDLLLLDYSLGVGMSGLDFYRKLRAQNADIPAILVTGFSDEGRAIEALRAGVRDVIPKVGDYLDYLPDAVGRVLEQVRAARALTDAETASRAKDKFLAILSHELRTPLTPVLAAVQMLETADDLPPHVRVALELIRRNVEMEARLIDDLLDLTGVSRGKLRLQISPTNVHQRLSNAMETVKDEVKEKHLCIVQDFRATHTRVDADPTRLQQVFWNVLKNAVKFTAAGGSVVVRTVDTEEGGTRVIISDTGIGIAPESLGRIFDAFEQGDSETARQYGGLGLGLNISKALIEAHGGRITVASEGVGRGASFAIELPARQGAKVAEVNLLPQASGNADPASVSGTPKPRVLLVEDHPDTAAMMAKLLRLSGHHVTTADSVASALEVAGAARFDVVVSDIGLPDGSGLDLMRQLSSKHGLRGIALSGFGMEEDLSRSIEAGFAEHLVKPVSMDQLEQAMQRVWSASTQPAK